MSLREKQQMNLDTESATHIGMEGPSRCSHKHLLLQVWCGLLTVAMVVMAAFFTSIKPKSIEGEVSVLLQDNVRPTASPSPFTSTGSSRSYIQLFKSPDGLSWEILDGCQDCSLFLHNNSIHSKEDSVYFIYAQVTFSKHLQKNQTRSVILIRNASYGRSMKKLVEGTFPHSTDGSVWVAKIVSLGEGDSVSLNITGDCLNDSKFTFWGAYQLR